VTDEINFLNPQVIPQVGKIEVFCNAKLRIRYKLRCWLSSFVLKAECLVLVCEI